ncbi:MULTISPECIES: efflux RND transporter periplasmic adaptor subunit [unclassified Sphingomonas]|uniref:efflux RND transporter periplasmic adaptor subunit n=1 Tax=unclassified Sphingomonas TaxID=196159 RepID=UPI0006F45466|nr:MULTISPECIES: efflux RND transporter periplasmic adaptor subunit [unclassified Sphingomonas]KQX20057.1 secretion protein HylD [Sphingomonas sp. Root1294]KQY67307.1 secretion protein HylD [Sphingomonas sp. Root50]KRB90682.1 secretion protein HylD [Sphingomonas sp. Root720]
MSKARKWLWLSLVLAALLGGYFIWWVQPRELVLTRARIGPAVELVYATGFVEADQPVSVAARLTAPVVSVLVDEGDRVRRGQPLVILDDEDQRGLLAQARAQSRGSELAERRITTLFAQGWVTRAARDEAVTTADAARAAERTARAHVGQNVIRAGIAGMVLKRDVEPGELATPSRVLMLLGDPARIRVTATVDERDVPRIRVGQQALMSSDAWPGRILRGRVRALTPGGDPTQRAFRVRLALDQAAALPMGLTLEVNIVTDRVERAVLVPSAAVSAGHIWIVEAGRAHRRAVRTGLVDRTTTEARSGVRPGDWIVADPPSDLAEGDRVRAGGAT